MKDSLNRFCRVTSDVAFEKAGKRPPCSGGISSDEIYTGQGIST